MESERRELAENSSSDDIYSHATKRLIYHFTIATALVFLTFGLNYLFKERVILGSIETFFGLLQFYSLYRLNRYHDYLRISRILVFSVYIMSYIIFITGGLGGTGHLWILFIPLFTMLLLRHTESKHALIGYSIGLVLIVAAGHWGIFALKYDHVTTRQTLLVFALFLYLTYHNEKIKNMVRDRLHMQNKELEQLSRTDTLTGLANRLYLNKKLAVEYARVQRYSDPLSLIIVDLDHFKQVNDTYGHLAGDQVLKSLSNLFTGNTREIDFIGRWGGEEFMIILPETEIEGAKVIAEHLRKLVSDHDFGLDISITASFGVTQYQPGDSLQSFIQKADHILYQAKEAGRNCVIA